MRTKYAAGLKPGDAVLIGTRPEGGAGMSEGTIPTCRLCGDPIAPSNGLDDNGQPLDAHRACLMWEIAGQIGAEEFASAHDAGSSATPEPQRPHLWLCGCLINDADAHRVGCPEYPQGRRGER